MPTINFQIYLPRIDWISNNGRLPFGCWTCQQNNGEEIQNRVHTKQVVARPASGGRHDKQDFLGEVHKTLLRTCLPPYRAAAVFSQPIVYLYIAKVNDRQRVIPESIKSIGLLYH